MSLLYSGDQNWMQKFRCDLTKAKQRRRITFPNILPIAAQDNISHCCKGTLPAHAEAGVPQHPQLHFCRAAFQLCDSQQVLEPGFVPPLMQDLALLVELHEVPVIPLQPAGAPLAYQSLLPVSCHVQTC